MSAALNWRDGITPLDLDRSTSTVTVDDRRFPCVLVVCPPTKQQTNDCDWCRSLGSHDEYMTAYIPLENGLLVTLDPIGDEPGTGVRRYDLALYARTCEYRVEHHPSDADLYLPWSVALADGSLRPFSEKDLRPHRRVGAWDFRAAYGDWVVEHIDRVSRLPFTQPPGPFVQLHRLGDDLQRAHDVGELCEG